VFCPEGCPPNETKKISVSLKDATVREALNAVAREHEVQCGGFASQNAADKNRFLLISLPDSARRNELSIGTLDLECPSLISTLPP